MENTLTGWHRIFEDSFQRFFFDRQFGILKNLEECFTLTNTHSNMSPETFTSDLVKMLHSTVILPIDDRISNLKK